MRADSVDAAGARLAPDPWTLSGLLTTKQISPWQLRLGSLEPARDGDDAKETGREART